MLIIMVLNILFYNVLMYTFIEGQNVGLSGMH